MQVTISELRKALGDGAIETHPLGYVMRRRATDALDAAAVRAAARARPAAARRGRRGRAEALLGEALGLWRGPALADFAYEEFARSESRAAGGAAARRARATRLEAALALGRHAEAVPELEALVREHPLHERLRELLMLALYRTGRQADALAVYQEARAALLDELGLDPGQPLQRLEKAILQQDASLDAAAVAGHAAAPRRRPPVCASCGTANGPTPRTAARAGGARRRPGAETRKTVTVLFCDVVAYTELAGGSTRRRCGTLMSRFFELAAGAIERHGGTVEKFVGDEVMAVFGVPVVREDDALRAVRAPRSSCATLVPGARDRARARGSRCGSGSTRARSSPAIRPPGTAFVTGERGRDRQAAPAERRRRRGAARRGDARARRPCRRGDAARAAAREGQADARGGLPPRAVVGRDGAAAPRRLAADRPRARARLAARRSTPTSPRGAARDR